MKRGPGFKDETNNVYTRLRVLEFDKREKNQSYWKCFCDPELGGCGRIVPVQGRRLRNGETKSCGCLYIEMVKNRFGKNHPNWNPDFTDEDRQDRRLVSGYKEWRKAVYELDDYTCQKCGESPSGNLNAHHIESYRTNPTLRTEISNGITLCEDCHLDFHHQYGYGDNTKAQLKEFLYYGTNC